jgi:hypothetical protein
LANLCLPLSMRLRPEPSQEQFCFRRIYRNTLVKSTIFFRLDESILNNQCFSIQKSTSIAMAFGCLYRRMEWLFTAVLMLLIIHLNGTRKHNSSVASKPVRKRNCRKLDVNHTKWNQHVIPNVTNISDMQSNFFDSTS